MKASECKKEIELISMFDYFKRYEQDKALQYIKLLAQKKVTILYREQYTKGNMTMEEIFKKVKMTERETEKYKILEKRCPYWWEWVCYEMGTSYILLSLKNKALEVLEEALSTGDMKDKLKAAELVLKNLNAEQPKAVQYPTVGLAIQNNYHKMTDVQLEKQYEANRKYIDDIDDRDPLDPPPFDD